MAVQQTVRITAETGVHARPATALVNKAGHFSSDIKLVYNDKAVNLKSIMGVMSLGIPMNAELTVIAEGEDEKEALAAIVDVFKQEELGE